MTRLPMHGLRRTGEIDLDGEWEFRLLPSRHWKTVTVPELWTMREDTDRPHYTNVVMPFDEVPPQVPTNNPTGVYRRTVDLDAVAGGRTILHVGAAEGALTVSVNGRETGTSTDSHLAAEFDVTDALVAGANTIELTVAKWSPTSYLEDQDHWWHAGISRSVYLYTVPDIRLADLNAVADYDPDTARGHLKLTVVTAGLDHLTSNEWAIRVTLLGQEHTLPVSARMAPPTLPEGSTDRSQRPEPRLPADFMDLISINAAQAPIPTEFRAIPGLIGRHKGPVSPPGTAAFTLDGLEVPPWSAETPHLEDLAVALIAPDGTIADETRTRVGFRRVEITGRDLLVNGRRILIQGVNRHDFDPRTGRVVSRSLMLEELSLLKRCNVNAIRTAHYPNDPVFLDLCDEIGFYVVDEADIEGHAFASVIADDPRYLPEFLNRVSRMVLRDRNHPCVLMWSLGNETGHGASHDAAAAWVRRFDPTRPVHYEGAVALDWHGGHAASDVVCPMYPSFAALEAYSADTRADRPLITCEYAYSQGNSTGGLADYWRLFETLPGLQGGFIWEFKDHALDPDGNGHYRYGGDFGDEPNDGATVLNGIVHADLTPKPALFEARSLFSPVRIVSDADAALRGELTLLNRQSFADLNAFTFELRAETEAGPLPSVSIPTPAAGPGEEVTVSIPFSVRGVLALSVVVSTAADAVWAASGTEVAVEQVVLPRTLPVLPRESPAGAIELRHPLLLAAPQLCLWRALTDNDGSFALDQRFTRSGFFRLTATDVKAEDNEIVTRYETAFGDEVLHRRTITALGDGDWVFDEEVTLPENTMDGLRVGIEFELANGFDHARWVGLGPWENYPDRRFGALLGAWDSSIDALAVPYLVPQENGTRGETTELVLTGPVGTVRTTHATPLHINVGRYTIDQLEQADHWWQLPPSTRTIVHLDVAHRGVGTALLGPDTRPAHRLTGSKYAWSWRLTVTQEN
ncbi:glycoside hydrolase family 2 TIM barrel-domain containing protein [Streptomyces sp. NPDC096094]|uniref:glycoside hydrolase family 2 TIM barrel-domain containing protein n=1 Tax=Streptomyces sp. NPDC096094 TaxID=3366073 RepID=UPI0037F82A2F